MDHYVKLTCVFGVAFVAVVLPHDLTAQRADTVVRMAGPPRYAEVASLIEEMSIGVVDGAEEYMFGDIADIAVAKDGSVFVLDRKIHGVRVYDARGKYTRTIGRRGQGPGEIASGSGIGLLPDGRLLVWDTGNWRVNVYSPAGQAITHWALPSSGTGSMSRGLVVDSAGFVYVQKPIFTRPPNGRTRIDRVWLRLRPTDGAVVDTIEQPAWTKAPRELVATGSGGNSQSMTGVPFDPVPTWVISPHGYLITGIPDRYAFELHNAPRSVVSIRREVRPEPVSARERDSARKETETMLRRTEPGWSWGGVDVPATRPYYEGIHTGTDGRIWVARVKEVAPRVGAINTSGSVGMGPRPAPRPADAKPVVSRPALYDVFEPSGVFTGQVRIPPRVSTAVRNGDYVWGVAYDEDDVPSVKRYRIVWK
jgi:hypothetical protein